MKGPAPKSRPGTKAPMGSWTSTHCPSYLGRPVPTGPAFLRRRLSQLPATPLLDQHLFEQSQPLVEALLDRPREFCHGPVVLVTWMAHREAKDAEEVARTIEGVRSVDRLGHVAHVRSGQNWASSTAPTIALACATTAAAHMLLMEMSPSSSATMILMAKSRTDVGGDRPMASMAETHR